jgi:hypothetical protein
MQLGRDNIDYHIIEEGVKLVQNVPGMTVEVGTREGGGSQLIMETLRATNQNKTHISIDPFGNIVCEAHDNSFSKFNYTNSMRNKCMSSLYQLADELNIDFIFFQLEDTEFFNKYADGVPIYQEVKRIENTYSFAFFDGPHGTNAIIKEFQFFNERAKAGAVFVFDDVRFYDFPKIEKEHLVHSGWELVSNTGIKASYRKK